MLSSGLANAGGRLEASLGHIDHRHCVHGLDRTPLGDHGSVCQGMYVLHVHLKLKTKHFVCRS